MAAYKAGEWLYTEVECLKTTGTMGFARGIIRSEEGIKASGSGVFKLPANLAETPGVPLKDLQV